MENIETNIDNIEKKTVEIGPGEMVISRSFIRFLIFPLMLGGFSMGFGLHNYIIKGLDHLFPDKTKNASFPATNNSVDLVSVSFEDAKKINKLIEDKNYYQNELQKLYNENRVFSVKDAKDAPNLYQNRFFVDFALDAEKALQKSPNGIFSSSYQKTTTGQKYTISLKKDD